MTFLLFCQAVAPPAAAPGNEVWTSVTALGIAFLSGVVAIVTAVLRRANTSKLTQAVKQLAQHGAALTEHGKTLAEHTDNLAEHAGRFLEIEEQIEATDPGSRECMARVGKIETELQSERMTREARREEQARQDLALAAKLARIEESVRNIERQVDRAPRR